VVRPPPPLGKAGFADVVNLEGGVAAWQKPACRWLNKEESKMTAEVIMYTTAVCPYCIRAERLLEAKGVTELKKIRVDLDPEQRMTMMQKTGRRTVPQIYIGDTHVGGFDDLYALDQAGGLSPC
jgi:glutaredoxin 3